MRQKRRKPQRRALKMVGILTLSVVILAGCSDTALENSNAKSVYNDQAMKSVKVFKVIKQKIGDPGERVAEVLSSAQFNVTAKASGEIEQILKKRGEMIREGEPILKLKSADVQAQRDAAATALKNVQDAMDKAKAKAKKESDIQKSEMNNSIQKMELGMTTLLRSYNKMKNDYDIGLATKAQLFQMETQLMNARLDLDQAKQRQSIYEPVDVAAEFETQLKGAQLALQQAEQTLQNLEVKATASGLLMDMPLDTGMSVQNGTQIATIQRLDPIKIKAQLSEEESKLASSKTAMNYLLPSSKTKFSGPISYLAKVVDPQTKAYEINLEVPNKDAALLPGMKIKLQLSDESDQIVLTVPTYSIVKEGDNAFVFVLSGDTVEKRSIKLGRLNESNQEVLTGLKEGDLVVKTNPSALMDKERVQMTAIEEQ
ncbi:efflux RND transporter periplasmic adaptor subunit [Paenibacillus roseipurpureus]|uniref:Efflux RND transporter periplasmic adaptor subunit n=1 Tax=Paenibacillus roseopurpureus TaxID=2918901 RepID=A0AA96RI08_9BACL|nr:efflux RND transporter periplasmic adaptor subunit [Paenibacillus sp. MBLB1832]WNR43818.1 efflux RND transporter periplasmic adaptor subunit [Paenibacillus sp. MBLB1832]